MHRLVRLIFAASTIAAPSLAAHAGETRDFGNWHVVCDNGGTCVALGNAENSSQPAYVSVVFEADTPQPASVGLMFGVLDEATARRRDLSAAFQGEAGVQRTTDTARQTEDDFFRFRLPRDRVGDFVDRLAEGGVLRLELTGANTPYYAASIDLAQAKEALDWARLQAKPASLPVVHVKPVSQERVPDSLPDSVALLLPQGCIDRTQAAPDANAMRVSETSIVWRVHCAADDSQRFYLLDLQAGSARPVEFPGVADPVAPGALRPNAYLDAAHMAVWDQDPRDCPNVGVAGLQEEWVWTGAGFEQASVRLAPICLDTGDWPYLYRTETVTGR